MCSSTKWVTKPGRRSRPWSPQKTARSLDSPQTFELIDAKTGKVVLSGPFKPAGQVFRWDALTFWIADFSTWEKPGHYRARGAHQVGFDRILRVPDRRRSVGTRHVVERALLLQESARQRRHRSRRSASRIARRQRRRRPEGRLVRCDRRLRDPSFSPEPDLVLQSPAGAAGCLDAAEKLSHAGIAAGRQFQRVRTPASR